MFNDTFSGYVPSLGNGQGWGGGFNAPQPSQPRGNKIYVIDANDALSRMALPDTLMVYVQQDEAAIHEVYTDPAGRKLIRTRTLSEVAKTVDAPAGDYVTRKEFEELREALSKLTGGENA